MDPTAKVGSIGNTDREIKVGSHRVGSETLNHALTFASITGGIVYSRGILQEVRPY